MAGILAESTVAVFDSYRHRSIYDSDIEIRSGSPWNHGSQTPRRSFVESRLKSVLTIGDENLLQSESEEKQVKRVEKKVVSPCVCASVPEENGHIARKCHSSPLDSKRPQRLRIPLQSLDLNAMCAVMQQPMEVNEEGLHYAVACKKGRREFMEDTHNVIVNVVGDSKQAFFGVFDGHSGREGAVFAAKNIGQNIVDDAEFLKQEVGSGTVCVTALIIDGNLVVSNAGDCRAVINRNGVSEAVTCDHRAGREDERQRIENLGGIVDHRQGAWRVQGSLAVSRGIGDWHMKEWITAEPDTRKIEITSDCEFLILASDGLWDKVSNQEAVDITRPFCVEKQPDLAPLRGGLIAACKKLVEVAVTRKSQDDVSVMIIQLPHFCKNENFCG
eukprot:PITA_23858